MSDDLRFPVGKWKRGPAVDAATCATLIDQIAALPAEMAAAVRGLTDQQLDTPYRPDGWTPRQVVHHVADSHMNAFVRFKLGMTEDKPTIKPYNEALWAKHADTVGVPVDVSLKLLEALHQRWVVLLRSIDHADLAREINHPENGVMTLNDLLRMYAWHGKHHTAHIMGLRQRSGW